MKSYKMWINGQYVDAESGKTYTAVNPATEEVIAEIPFGDKADVDKAVASAKNAFPVWSAKSLNERCRILDGLADIFSDYSEELGRMETIDHGFPLKIGKAIGASPAGYLRNAIKNAKAVIGEIAPPRPEAMILMERAPIGVCALITPWNHPLDMAMSKLAACLAAGNTCILKPPTVDSITILMLADAIEKSELPKGAVNIITGPGGGAGEALITHPDVRMIGFTGSSEVGKRIMELGSCNLKRVTLELGGKNPFIVMDDANMNHVIHCAIHSSYFNSGQVCASPGRYYIQNNIYDEFVEKFTTASKKVIVGNPLDANTQMGPVVSKEHRDSVERYIQSGIDEGANLVLGGKRPDTPPLDKGYFVMPTIFTGVKQNMKIAREEIFGPVACIMEPFTSEDEVIEAANDNDFGLAGSVWSGNVTRAMKIASRIEAGGMWINEHMNLVEGMPWGGVKISGLGRENSHREYEEYTYLKTTYIDMTEQEKRPWNEL